MCSLAILFCLSFVAGDQPAIAEGGWPPEMRVVEGVRGDEVLVRFHMLRLEGEEPLRNEAGGDDKSGASRFKSGMTISKVHPIPLGDFKAFDLEGKPIPPEKLKGMFTRPTVVLYGTQGIPVAPVFLKAARQGTVLLMQLARPPEGIGTE